jgi:hypothetical protein
MRLDDRVWAVIDWLAAKSGLPYQRWIERHFFDRGKAEGRIRGDEDYPLDGRGGARDQGWRDRS